MSKEEWQEIYREAWSLYYTPRFMKTLLRRAAATGVPMGSLVKILVAFALSVSLENVHPLQAGVLRLKHPSERRPGLPRESAWRFWLAFLGQTVAKQAVVLGMICRLLVWRFAIAHGRGAWSYSDQALAPVAGDEDETLELLTETSGARAAVAHIKRVDELVHARGAA